MAPSGDSSESFVQRALPIYLGLLFAILTIVAVVVLFMVRHVLLVMFVSVLLAAALTGPSEWLHRRFRLPLGLAAAVIYVASFAVVVGIGWIVVPPLLGQVVEFADRAPEYAERYAGIREAYVELQADFPALPPFEEQLSRLGDAILDRAGERAAALPGDVFSIFVDLLAVFFVSLLLVTNRLRMRDFVLSLTHSDHRRRTGLVLDRTWLRIGGYPPLEGDSDGDRRGAYLRLADRDRSAVCDPALRARGLRRTDPAPRQLARTNPIARDRGVRQPADIRADVPGVDLDSES